jgi:hypothetical protein
LWRSQQAPAAPHTDERAILVAVQATFPLSPLELLLPRGRAAAARGFGERLPAGLVPAGDAGGALDLVVVAPSASEAGDAGFRSRVASAVASLAPDGQVYALDRSGLAATKGLGLEVAARLLHLPRGPGVRHLVELAPAALRLALSGGGIPMQAHSRRAVRLLCALPGGRRLLPGGTVLRRAGGPPLAAWLDGLADGVGSGGDLVLSRSWRGGGAVVLRRVGANRPIVAKLGASSHREADALVALRADAVAAGAAVPQLLARFALGNAQGVLMSLLPGRAADDVLARDDARVDALLGHVAAWLTDWNAATARPRLLVDADLDALLHAPARRLGCAPSYTTFLAELAAEAREQPLPFVAAHRDLTCSNLLVDGAQLGVIDWESATAEAPPLGDLLYLAADAVAAREGYADRPAAFAACFERGGAEVDLVEAHVAAATARLGLSNAQATLCVHACWLRHAVDETDAGEAPGPFTAIAARVAAGAAA